jgi:hypothetical protein
VDPVGQVTQDIQDCRPDALLHVVTAYDARALAHDFQVYAETQRAVARDLGAAVPTVMVLTMVDLRTGSGGGRRQILSAWSVRVERERERPVERGAGSGEPLAQAAAFIIR